MKRIPTLFQNAIRGHRRGVVSRRHHVTLAQHGRPPSRRLRVAERREEDQDEKSETEECVTETPHAASVSSNTTKHRPNTANSCSIQGSFVG